MLATTLLVGLLVGGCGERNRADERPSRTDDEHESGGSSDSTPSEDGRQEIIDAYLAASDAFNEAARGPDPDYPLEDTHTGPMLEQTRVIVEGLAEDGLVLEYPPNSQVSESVTSVRLPEDGVAILEVCTVDDGRRVRQDTGEVVAGGGISTVWADVAMERVDGTWKLAERRETDRRDGVAVCDADG